MDEKTVSTEENKGLTKYKVTIEDRTSIEELRMLYELEDNEFEAGDKVVFSVPNMTDTSISAKSEQVAIERENSDYGRIRFSFIMPAKDVFIDISMRSSMVNPMMNGGRTEGFLAMTGSFMNIAEGFMKMNQGVGNMIFNPQNLNPNGEKESSDNSDK